MRLLEALQGNLRLFIEAPWSEMILVMFSFLCGGIVGVERERSDKPAGLRTMMLICIGSTIFTLASVSPVLGVRDPARITAQIVTGVGFLGAGAIFRERRGVSGMTTAASIWATAGIGMIIGAGYAVPALALSFGVLVTLSLVGRVEVWMSGPCRYQRALIIFRSSHGKTSVRIQDALDTAKGFVRTEAAQQRSDGSWELAVDVCRSHREHRAVLAILAEIPGVEDVMTAPPSLPGPVPGAPRHSGTIAVVPPTFEPSSPAIPDSTPASDEE